MAVKRFSNSLISQSGQDKVTNFIAGYSPAVDEMDLIQRITLNSVQSTITFSNIPQTYQHLQLRYVVRGNDAASNSFPNIGINNDFYSTNYSSHTLGGSGTSAYATATSNTGGIGDLYGPTSSDTAGIFAVGISNILDYTSTSKNKVVRTVHGYDKNGGGYIILSSGSRYNTSAVTSLSLFNVNFVIGSTASLYGVLA